MFVSIDALRQEFCIEPSLPMDQLIAELKRRRVSIHPDKSDGAFLSSAAELQYTRLSEALEYLEKPVSNELTIQTSTDFHAIKTSVVALESAVEQIRLDRSSQSQVESTLNKEAGKFSKVTQITAGTFAAVFTALLGFSKTIPSNPVLAPIAESNMAKGCILLLLCLAGGAYLMAWVNELRVKNMIRFLMSDIGLSAVLYWRVNSGPNKEPTLEILKQQIVKDILDMGDHWYSFYKYKVIRRFKLLLRIRIPHGFAERIADIVLSMLIERGVIRKKGMRGVHPLYIVDASRARESIEDGHIAYFPSSWRG